MQECEMCRNINNPIEEWDKPIFESQNFVSFPSVGAFVEGYMLVLPKFCKLAMADIPSEHMPELIEFTHMVAYHVQKLYGQDVAIFEHGPRACSTIDDSCTACIDHAHFHIVPIPYSLDLTRRVTMACPDRTHIESCQIYQLPKFMLRNYLFLKHRGYGRIFVNETFRSQLIRNVIAEYLGIGNEYNWRSHPQFENLKETIEAFKSYIKRNHL